MLNISEVKVVTRAASQVGRVAVKPVDMVHVAATEGFTSFGLNVHTNGKIEFFRDSMYTLPAGAVFNAMLAAAKA